MKSTDPEDVLDVEDLDDEQESPYRRGLKPVQVRWRRFSQRLGKVLRWSFVGAVMLVPFGYGSFHLARYALHSPRFSVTAASDVAVEGNQYVTNEEVVTALGLPLSKSSGFGMNVFRISLDQMRKHVETIAWVCSATLTRAYPHRLIVHIVEREPVAFVNVGGELKLVDVDEIGRAHV